MREILDFFSPSCVPCRLLSPVLDEIEKLWHIPIRKVDVCKDPQTAAAYAVTCVPTIIFIENKKVVRVQAGNPGAIKIRKLVEAWVAL